MAVYSVPCTGDVYGILRGMAKRMRWHRELKALFYDVQHPWFHVVNDVLAAVTVISVLSIVLETVPALAEYEAVFMAVEWIAVVVFTAEYVGRVIANHGHVRRYVLSFFGIIDLLAIIPSFLGLSNLTFLKTARTLRLLRLLRMLRLAKLASVTSRPRRGEPPVDPEQVVLGLSLQIYLVALSVGVLLFGTMMYLAEGGQEAFHSIPHAMVWALKVTMGGVPIESPFSVWGETVLILTRFFGLLMFGLLLSVVGTVLRKVLLGGAR